MRRMLFIAVLGLAGCQGGFSIGGQLPADAVCMLSLDLADRKDSLAKFPQQRKVSGAFRELFAVDPTRHTYEVAVTCESKVVSSRKVNYPSEVSPARPLELGAVELKHLAGAGA